MLQPLPLMSTMDIVGYSIVGVIAAAILITMFLLIKATTDQSDKHSYMKEIVEALFGTPAHLRQGQPEEKKTDAASAAHPTEAFEEECPACQAKVTHQDADCPACGLRLL